MQNQHEVGVAESAETKSAPAIYVCDKNLKTELESWEVVCQWQIVTHFQGQGFKGCYH